MRIFCCDDSPSFLLLLEDWLDDHDDIELVGTAEDRAGALARVQDGELDVIVTDTFAPFGDARFLRALREAAPGARIVLYTGYSATELPDCVIGAADAVVRKGADEQSLVDALRALMR
jgi:two-component system, response regulator, stage 0 sporulation protein A